MKSKWTLVGLMALALACSPLLADVWDTATDNDNGAGTDNEIVHGTEQIHNMPVQAGPVADQDWFRVNSFGYSSHEFVVDGITGDLAQGSANPINLDRVTSGGTIVNSATALPGGDGYARSLRWQNTTATSNNEYVRVSGPACGTSCTTSDQYTARYFETTATLSRYNNSGTQVTVLILANPNAYTISGTAWFFNATSTLIGSTAISIGSRDTDVIATNGIAGVNGQSGFIIITHNGRYGDLRGKAVALEPSTGFSFDTPLEYKEK